MDRHLRERLEAAQDMLHKATCELDMASELARTDATVDLETIEGVRTVRSRAFEGMCNLGTLLRE